MILNGKAKENFEKWYFENHCSSNMKFEDLLPYHIYDVFGWLYKQSFTIQNALIIEFFDSVEIHICITPVFPIYIYGYSYSIDLDNFYEYFKNRQEATVQVIKKANDIHNERFK